MENKLYCGAARRIVTPPEALLPNLRGNVGAEFNAVLDDLNVRVIALGDGTTKALIICFESGYPCNDELFERIEQTYHIPPENVMLLQTHVHAAPMINGAINCGVINPRKHVNNFLEYPEEVQKATISYVEFLMEQMFSAIDEAIASMRPARMGHEQGESLINVCRNQCYTSPDGRDAKYALGADAAVPIDHTLFVMRFETLDGKPIAFFINYPVHNCVMVFNHCGKDGKGAISSDISGRACRYLEQEFDGCVALWTSGAAGDINPVFGNELFYPDPVTGGPIQLETKGGEIANAILEVLSARHYADILSVIRKIEYTTDRTQINGVIEWSATPGVDGQDHIVEDLYQVRLHLLRVGDVGLFGASGELFDSLGRLIKETSPMKHTVVLNHDARDLANSEYIYDDEAFRHSPGLVQSTADAIPNSSLGGGIVAINHSQMVPGYFPDSLKRHTRSMFEKVL